jgi:hypothetical protein
MPLAHRAFTYIPPTYITPIACPHCGSRANLVRREYRAELKGELRTFRCVDCANETEIR